ncbi:hypothetical protein QWI17_11515 [Gilvimarinus sp. SDUM040013]|uniref:Uncharacterized protein n=1 Tax=Gilvimarinus gilvus TaxID=3058038 RepID=A0ABU4RZY4_9GAMM|nr:hypothetical protein [Gilvimarinus sp. SDUM040013]MDO3386465.1 hypothetical protein [Gilvimarinus sp. SDUM040013]MDX6849731.1 hypothetical protein [Gilvimarinus sp. SDUM040013]
MAHSAKPYALKLPGGYRRCLRTFFLATSMALSCVTSAHENYLFICELEGATRQIEVAYLVSEQDVPCEVRYQKNDGDGTVLWRANNQGGFCENKAASLVSEHKTLGFQCESENLPEDLPQIGEY